METLDFDFEKTILQNEGIFKGRSFGKTRAGTRSLTAFVFELVRH
jgi:hypothetical protein